ncbi:hypothetical protein BV25DRAFT_1524282 [Artomyces pyxidatus]|uniref:Uncharacterized protein n=1 Tax=Artomyces pyxidatus TaxID=48021 RepID=A0ACB8TD22_9AGAM|nr:hypothetical protein BV25DRAFT_1524282 [Artomyces pyxidatus]
MGGHRTQLHALILQADQSGYTSLRLWGDNRNPDWDYAWYSRISQDYWRTGIDRRTRPPNHTISGVRSRYNVPTLSGETALWTGLCLTELRELGIQLACEHVWAMHRWLYTFRDATKVQLIVVRGARAALNLAAALTPPIVGTDIAPPSVLPGSSLVPSPEDDGIGLPYPTSELWSAPEPDTLLFPALKTIVIRDLRTDRPRFPDSYAVLEVLSESLGSRLRQGASQLDKVEIPPFNQAADKVTSMVNLMKAAGVRNVVVRDDPQLE